MPALNARTILILIGALICIISAFPRTSGTPIIWFNLGIGIFMLSFAFAV